MRVAVFTSGRQDWSILAPVARAIAASPHLALVLVAGGLHLDGDGPRTLDGLAVDALVRARPERDDALAVACTAGATTGELAEILVAQRAEALLLLGDRSETLAAGLAATCLRLPLVHLHGGERTAGAIDDACRHALTKLAHLHCVSHERHREVVLALGERADRVHVTGAPALDQIHALALLGAPDLARELGRAELGAPLVVLTHHPTTLGGMAADDEIAAVLAGTAAALAGAPRALVVMTRANHDHGGPAINAALARQAAADPRFVLVAALGALRYYSLLALADAMVGNSSSGILEAPSFALPVVNVGTRQGGRLRAGEVVDVPVAAPAITAALAGVLARPRRKGVVASAFGDGRAAARIRALLEGFASETPAARLAKEGA